jgi:hypothetical protein
MSESDLVSLALLLIVIKRYVSSVGRVLVADKIQVR